MFCVFHRRLNGLSGGRFVSLYESMISEGKIRPDPRQVSVVNLLQSLADRLENSGPSVPFSQSGSMSGFGNWFNRSKPHHSPSSPLLRGLYIYGGCGTGKTMLMDMFFSRVDFSEKKRVHFHEYMIDVHSRLIRAQKLNAEKRAKCNTEWTGPRAAAQRQSGDLVEQVANELMSESRLLCFDEFQVTFISDAVIMRRLFSFLFQKGIVVVATSNRPPEDLYLNGLNRELFTPFIPLLKEYCVVHNMDSAVDYRQLTSSADEYGRVYFHPLSEKVTAGLEAKFFRLARNSVETTSVEVQGRSIPVRRSGTKTSIAWFSFKELCDKPLGSADYIAIAKRYHTVFIDGIPKLTLQERDQVRRLITLVDALYDHNVRIVISSDVGSCDQIFEISQEVRKSSSMDEVFAWDRTLSRLTEMMSIEYQIKCIRRMSASEFFSQFELDDASFTDQQLREIFVRYDKNNDQVIAVTGLNRMVSELASQVGEKEVFAASESVLRKLSPNDGRRIQYDAFKDFVNKYGLLALQDN
jgi:predicted ATPase